ncbi:hypothetical protein SLS62_000493 [Diatrype stigma]|uniref:Uncharacterized protein n=1 Tax=Diatrype stigma TaxID=117547 RepID=A0AAN9VC88_9PEZI
MTLSDQQESYLKQAPPLRRVSKTDDLRGAYSKKGEEAASEEEHHQKQQQMFNPSIETLRRALTNLKKVGKQGQDPETAAAPLANGGKEKTVDELVQKYEQIEEAGGQKTKRVHWAPGF